MEKTFFCILGIFVMYLFFGDEHAIHSCNPIIVEIINNVNILYESITSFAMEKCKLFDVLQKL